MTPDVVAAAVVGLVVGGAVAATLVPLRIGRTPERLARVNISGRRVPATLGDPLVGGGLAAIVAVRGAAAAGWVDAPGGSAAAAVALVVIAMAAAGRVDDLRGDEPARGFRGHLSARRVTGGVVKIAAGGVSGLLAGALIAASSDPLLVIETAGLVGLGANLVNLLDRAPGRAAKVWLLVALPLLVAGDPAWATAAAGLVGASLVCLPPDLRERAMLGDAGANPLGAAAGVGLALSLDRPGRIVALIVLLALNAASERVSFSRVIDGTPLLRALDRIGRK